MGDTEAPIAFFDSGVGGLPYLAMAKELLPHECFVYVADREGFPYGTKTGAEVREIVLDRVGRLMRSRAPKALVIACNTASQAALQAVRSAFPGLIVIGTVPAVKPAALSSVSNIIGVMATARAVEDPYLDELVRRHAEGVRVLREPAQDLVSFVERRCARASAEERRAAVKPYVERLIGSGADRIVLACTHFLHVAEDIAASAREIAARTGVPAAEVVDSRDGVARRLEAVLRESGLLCALRSNQAPGFMLLTGHEPFEPSYADFASRFGLSGPFPLDGKSR